MSAKPLRGGVQEGPHRKLSVAALAAEVEGYGHFIANASTQGWWAEVEKPKAEMIRCKRACESCIHL
jgi:hypothetical protein